MHIHTALTVVSHPTLQTPTKPVPPKRVKNSAVRAREYLTQTEVARLIDAAGTIGRLRDRTLVLLAYRHALRVAELVSLHWSQVDLDERRLHVHRIKHGTPSVHPLGGPEIQALRQLKRDHPRIPYLWVSERQGPLTAATVRKLIARAGIRAGLDFPVHPHMLRHACGYYLANAGHDTRAIQHYLGHKSIQHTVRYTELASDRFNGFWPE